MSEIANPAPGRIQAAEPPLVWVVGPFTNPARMAEGDRFLYLAERVRARGARVTFFTSGFDHQAKRPEVGARAAGPALRARFEPGYSANVSVRRVLSHLVFDLGLALGGSAGARAQGSPRSIYCPIRTTLSALLLGLLARAIGSRLVIDVHDTWPESLLAVHRLRPYERRCSGSGAGPPTRPSAWPTPSWPNRRATPSAPTACAGRAGFRRRAASTSAATWRTTRRRCRRSRCRRDCGSRFPLRVRGDPGRNYDLELVVRTARAVQTDHPGACPSVLVRVSSSRCSAPSRRRWT